MHPPLDPPHNIIMVKGERGNGDALEPLMALLDRYDREGGLIDSLDANRKANAKAQAEWEAANPAPPPVTTIRIWKAPAVGAASRQKPTTEPRLSPAFHFPSAMIRPHHFPLMFATLLPFASGSVRAQTPELQPTFTRLSGNQGSLNWNHVAGRVYFGKFSMDLQSWTFAPIVALGTGAVVPPYLLDTDGGRYFVRLRYTVATNYTQGEAGDLDGDGISNLDEMTYFGTDPLVSNDAEGDGTLVSGRKLAGLLIRMPQWSA